MKEHFEELFQLVKNEKNAETDAYQSLVQNKKLTERIEEGVTLYPLQYKEFRYNSFEELLIQFSFDVNQNGTLFGTNGRCQLFTQNNNEFLDATIYSIKENVIEILIHDDELPEWIKDGKLGLNALPDTRTYDIQLNCLQELIESEKGLAYDFYQTWDKGYQSEFFQKDSTLNDSQNEAVKKILSTEKFTIVHGPPGTGKTKTLSGAIKQIIQSGKKILVATPTNAACDHITQEVAKFYSSVVRYGHSFKISEGAFKYTLQNKIQNHKDMDVIERLKKDAIKLRQKADKYIRNFTAEDREERKQMNTEIRQIKRDIKSIQQNLRKYLINESQVICGTLIGLQTEELAQQNFDFIMIDEAGQALEPAIWSLANNSHKLVLAGDPLQLPPTLFSVSDKKNNLAISLIERAFILKHETNLLNIQYRMHESIMQFSNQEFYESKLIADNSVAKQTLDNEDFLPVEFIDTAGSGFEEDKDENGGISNRGEIKLIQERLNFYLDSKNSLAIISPYRKQVSSLLENIDGEFDINTIDSFQGQERDIIIISLVRSNHENEIGFLKDYRRMNVAMTRAKRKLIIVGDSATIAQDPFYQRMLEYIEKSGSYRSAYEFPEIFN